MNAGAEVAQPRRRRAYLANAVSGAAALSEVVGPNRAGRLVPVPEEALQADRSFSVYWALWAAVVLIVLVLAAGYLRRRWKGAGRPRSVRWLAWGRDHGRK